MSANAATEPGHRPPAGPARPQSAGTERARRAGAVVLIAVIAVMVVAFGTDTTLGARSEYSLSQSLRAAPRLEFDPEVTLGGFPFVRQAQTGVFGSLVVTARGVAMPRAGSRACVATQCRAELGAEVTGVDAGRPAWSWQPDELVHFDALRAYSKLDSVNLGRMLDIVDLTVNTPAPENEAGGGGPGDGLLERSSGVLLTGTVALPPEAANRSPVVPSASAYRGDKVRVSVNVDLSATGNALRLTATGFYTGPEQHADGVVPDRYRQAVLDRFSAVVALPPLPWGVVATGAHSAGSDVLITGTAHDRTVRVADF